MSKQYVIGVDFGTDSVRSIIVNAANGNEVAAAVFNYPRWKDGLYCDASINQFRQHPLDYIEGLESTIKSCLQQVGSEVAANIKAISVDTTGSTPVAVDETGIPLALLPAFEENPHAMFVRWKDHTATTEAVAPLHDLPKLPVAGVLWKPYPDMKTGCAAWILAGGTHHTGYSQNLTAENMQDFAEMANIEFALIGKHTNLYQFKNELRWNEVYYQINK